jgi:hypothetical protein
LPLSSWNAITQIGLPIKNCAILSTSFTRVKHGKVCYNPSDLIYQKVLQGFIAALVVKEAGKRRANMGWWWCACGKSWVIRLRSRPMFSEQGRNAVGRRMWLEEQLYVVKFHLIYDLSSTYPIINLSYYLLNFLSLLNFFPRINRWFFVLPTYPPIYHWYFLKYCQKPMNKLHFPISRTFHIIGWS